MRNSIIRAVALLGISGGLANAGLSITGVIDGPRTGGTPKAIELYASTAIADLSIYNVETPNNGGVATGSEFALTGSASAGQHIYIATEAPEFTTYFGFAPTFTSGVANINGDDNVILYQSAVIVDEFGEVGVSGTGKPWEYMDGYAYRKPGTGPDAVFNADNWLFSGINFLDSQTTTGVNGSDNKTVPFSTFGVPEPSTILVAGILGMLVTRRRRAL